MLSYLLAFSFQLILLYSLLYISLGAQRIPFPTVPSHHWLLVGVQLEPGVGS